MGTRNRVGIGLLYRPARARICKPFKEPRIDSQPGGPVREPYLLYWLSRFHRLVEGSLNVYKYGLRLHCLAELVPWNRFLGSLNIYKYELRLHWPAELVPWNRFLGSLNVYKYGLRLHWLAELVPLIPRLHNMNNNDQDVFFGSKWIYSSLKYQLDEE